MLNKHMIIGNMTEPKVRTWESNGTQNSVTTFSVACDREFSKEKVTDWFNVEVWGKTGEYVANYGAKGRLVYVEGAELKDNYTDKEGNKREAMKLRADRVRFLDRKPATTDDAGTDAGTDAAPSDEDIPF